MDPAAPPRTSYPSDADDEERTFVVPYVTVMDAQAPNRRYPLRELFEGVRRILRISAERGA